MQQLSRFRLAYVCLCCVLMLLGLGLQLGAQTGDPKAAGDPKGLPQEPPKKISLDKFKMPPGGAIVLVEEGKDLRSYFPRMVILTPEKHQELMDRLAQLEKQVKGDRKSPHSCKLTATVEGDVLRVAGELHFQVDQPRSNVFLGFRGTQFGDATIRARDGDGAWQPAVIDVAADGYVVLADKAGDYQLKLELKLPLVTSGGAGPGAERSFEIALPGAAVTTLTLEMSEAVKEIRWNRTNVEKPSPPATEQKRWEVAAGKVTQLHVAWKEPLAGGTVPLRTVRGAVTVRVEDAQVLTTAELTLTDLRGKAKEWRLLAPPQAKVKVLTPENLAHKILYQAPYLHVLQLAAPTADAIKVQITLQAPRPVGKVPVGPFPVQDVLRQEGTIEIKLPVDARRGLRLLYHVAGALEEREPPREQPGNEVVAVFKYWDVPTPPKNANLATIAKTMAAPLEVELLPIQGKVETHVEHNLRLRQGEQGWEIVATCKIVARPLDAPVDFLDVQLPRIPPEAYPLLGEPSAGGFPGGLPWGALALSSQLAHDGEWVLGNAQASVELQYPEGSARSRRKVRAKWNQPQSKEFSVTLVGVYALPAGAQRVRLELPRPLAILDRGAKGRFEVDETLELLTQDGGPELPVAEKHQYSRTWERAPLVWDLAWRSYRPEFPVSVVTDIAFRPHYANVSQQLTWEHADRPRGPLGKPAMLRLRVPAEVKGLKVVSGGKLVHLDRDKQLAQIDVAAGKGSVVLKYDFLTPVSANPADFRVPLIWPEQATHVETRLRLWSPPGIMPALAEPSMLELAWKDAGTETVPGRDSLPGRVLASEGLFVPLFLRLNTAPGTLPRVVIDRVLVQVAVDDDGTKQYRARFLLSKVNANSLEVRMPVPLANLAPSFLLDGEPVPWQPADSSGLVAKLDVDPNLSGRSILLEVNYQLPRDQPSTEGLCQTTLDPPVLDGHVFLGKVRWQVTLPPSMLAVAARGHATTEQRLAWRGWLPSLEPALSTSDLERWLTGQELQEPPSEGSLVSGSGSLEPLRVFRVSRAVWFLLCSGFVLLGGLALYLLPPRPAAWLAVVALGLVGLAVAGWFWPEVLPAVTYGAGPGFVVLALLLALQWMLHQRYKRQLLFLPGFTRVKAGSSLLRASSIHRGREPSTIDAPAPPDKSSSAKSGT
jgi:hypothetical protein